MKETAELIRRALDFPVAHVTERYAREQDLPEEVAREHEVECKRFLALCAAYPGKNYGMRGQIDKYWHTFIMFTKEYEKFCNEVAGRFLHHAPQSPMSEDPKGSSSHGYRKMLQDYEVVFGEAPPTHLWPKVGGVKSAAMELCSFNLCSCDSCTVIPDPPDSCTEPTPEE